MTTQSNTDPFVPRTDGNCERPETTDPFSLLLDKLNDLIYRSTHHKGNGTNLLEKYDYFIRHSNKGRICTYSHKCKQLFYMSDFQEVKQELSELINIIRTIPGEEDFGK